MEHRNSTILTDPVRLRIPDEQQAALSTAAHEFFHSWNVERMRPRAIEPFRLDAPNPSGELWFAEGFTNYYGPLTLHRAGLSSLEEFAGTMGRAVDLVVRAPARKYRSAEDVSRFSQFIDAAVWPEPTNFDNHFVSYYDWGSIIALGLDLSLRARSDHKVTLDDYMRRMWQEFGRVTGHSSPGHPNAAPPAEGVVARPYTSQDLRRVLADVSGDRGFADDFFDRFIHGRDVPDYAALLARAGLVLRKRSPGRPWIGDVSFDFSDGTARVNAPTVEGTPLYLAGIDHDDQLLSFDGVVITGASRLDEAVQRRRPGDRVRVSIRRRGVMQDLTLTIGDDPTLQVVPVERTGRQTTSEQRAFRNAWLASRQ